MNSLKRRLSGTSTSSDSKLCTSESMLSLKFTFLTGLMLNLKHKKLQYKQITVAYRLIPSIFTNKIHIERLIMLPCSNKSKWIIFITDKLFQYKSQKLHGHCPQKTVFIVGNQHELKR